MKVWGFSELRSEAEGVGWSGGAHALLWGTVNSSSCWAEIDGWKVREKARKIDGPHHVQVRGGGGLSKW